MTERKKISWIRFAPTDREHMIPNLFPIHWLAFTNQAEPHSLIDAVLARWPEPAAVKEYLEISADIAVELWNPPYPEGWFVMALVCPMSEPTWWEGHLADWRGVLERLRRARDEALRPEMARRIERDYEPEEEMLYDFDARSYADASRIPRHLLPVDDQRELGKGEGRILGRRKDFEK